MVKRLMAIMLMATLTMAVVSVGGVAEADEPDYTDIDVIEDMLNKLKEADDPDAAFLRLPLDAQNALVDAFRTLTTSSKVVKVTTDEGGIRGASDDPGSLPEPQKCDTHTVKVTKTLARIKIYTYKSSTRWCYNGRIITQSPSFNVSARLHWKIWWEFVGHVSEKESGGRGESLHTDFAQGHFKNCPPSFGCVHYYPSIKKTQTAKGIKSSVTHDE